MSLELLLLSWYPASKGSLLVAGGGRRAEDAQEAPTQSHISPSLLVYEEKHHMTLVAGAADDAGDHALWFMLDVL